MKRSRLVSKITASSLPILGALGLLSPLPVSAHDAAAGPIGRFFTSFPLESYILLALGLTLGWFLHFSRRRKGVVAFALLVVLGTLDMWTIQQTRLALAATSLLSPNGGECIKGGANTNIQWSSDDPSYNHGYVSYSTSSGSGGSYATFNGGGPNFLGHPVSSPYSWSTPSITSSTMRVYAESHDGPHSVLSSMLSAADFSLDSSLPTAPTASSPSKTSTTVSLSWTASTDSGCMGLTGYKVSRDGNEIATALSGTTFTDTGLTASTAYAYVVTAYDSFGSTASATVNVTTDGAADTTAPAAVSNLATSGNAETSMMLTWTAPGDDGSTGTAASYEIRYSTATITGANFSSATLVASPPAPQAAGAMQTKTVTGLMASTTYFFAMKTSDEVPNVSGLSNVASGATTAATSMGGGGSSGGGGTSATSVTVSAPNGGETLSASTTVPIVWSATGANITGVNITLSTDSGATFPTVIASNLPNNGSYSWIVPAITTTKARVKVETLGGVTASDTSNGDFTIQETASTSSTPPTPTTTATPTTSAPTVDPTRAGTYTPSVAIASTPSIDVDKAIVAPTAPTSPAPCTAGRLIKGSRPDSYYCGKDGKRYVFVNEKVFFSWFQDFNNMDVLSDVDLAKIPLGGNVTYKPGVRMIKIQSDPKVYAVSRGGLLRWVKTEAVANALYGVDWNKKIDDVSDALFVNYKIGDPIETAP